MQKLYECYPKSYTKLHKSYTKVTPKVTLKVYKQLVIKTERQIYMQLILGKRLSRQQSINKKVLENEECMPRNVYMLPWLQEGS